jgi:hypothetical protein
MRADNHGVHILRFFKMRFIAKKVYTACTITSYKIVRLTNFNKYLDYDTSETAVNVNTSAISGS